MKILLKNARILSMEDSDIVFGDILIENNRIKKISEKPLKEKVNIIRDCHGNLLMPGFKNAHAHSAMTFLRSKSDGLKLHDWLFDVVFPREKELKEEDVYHFAKVAYLEYIRNGITACFDQYYFPHMSAKAAEEMGMRVVLLGTYNGSYEKVLSTYHYFNDKKDSLITYCLGVHAEYTTGDIELEMMKKAVKELKAPFYAHISETKDEVDNCYKARGCSPVKFFADAGLFDYGGGGYHCIYFNEEDIKIFKDKKLNAVSCPGSNTKLSSGIPPITDYLEAGINVALGTDGPASNNCLDMFKEMALTFSLQNLRTKNPNCLASFDILKMATCNAARAMGLNECDVLKENKLADIIEIDLSSPNMQPLNDIITNIVYSGNPSNISMTMINGKILFDKGEFFLDESIDDIFNNCQKATDELEKRYLSHLHDQTV